MDKWSTGCQTWWVSTKQVSTKEGVRGHSSPGQHPPQSGPPTLSGQRWWSPLPPVGPSVISAEPTGVLSFVFMVDYSHWLLSGHSLKSTPVGPCLGHTIIQEHSSHGPSLRHLHPHSSEGHTPPPCLWPAYTLKTSDSQNLNI